MKNSPFDNQIKAIDTEYADHLFRSRLEARWAIYFDELGVTWEYEKEGYELGNGERYLPDFYFPKYRMFAEVKPVKFDFREHSKCKRLSVLTQKIVVELVGLPNIEAKEIILPSQYQVCSKCGKKETYDFSGKREYCKCRAKHDVLNRVDVVDGFLLFVSDKPSYSPIYCGTIHDEYTKDRRIKNAVIKAKSARFEFGHKN